MSAKPEALPTPGSIAKYVKQNMQKARKSTPTMGMMHHAGGQEIVREDDYQGHHIEVRTTYHIAVDGQEVTGHIMLTNTGQVQYHGLPNHSFDSTIGLVRALIDNFPEDFDKTKKPARPHGGKRSTGGKRGPMGGMKMPGMGAARPAKAALKKQQKKKSAPKSKGRTTKSKSK
ncbi:MAG TPA: hypothetical protein VNW97_17570 [Candidatus Saccharimonadales bacterium]|jgi:hypothetical protein|nr:hypothetical protein [Candidatus Saccharimonadales bacterium]